MRSRILVMDEPTAGQDYKNYMDFMDAILQLPSFEAILFITHDVDLAVILRQPRPAGQPGSPGGGWQTRRKCWAISSACAAIAWYPPRCCRPTWNFLPRTGRFMRAEALAHIPAL